MISIRSISQYLILTLTLIAVPALYAKAPNLTADQAVSMLEQLSTAIEQNAIFVAQNPRASWHDLPYKATRPLYSILRNDNLTLILAIDYFQTLSWLKLTAEEYHLDVLELIELFDVMREWSGNSGGYLFMMLVNASNIEALSGPLPVSKKTPSNRLTYIIEYLKEVASMNPTERTKEMERSFDPYYHEDLSKILDNIRNLDQERKRVRSLPSHQASLATFKAWMHNSSIANDSEQERLFSEVFGKTTLQRWKSHYPALLNANEALGQMAISIAVQLSSDSAHERLQRYQAIFTHQASDLANEILSREKKYLSTLQSISKNIDRQGGLF